jgi:hypothetical protein
LGGIAGPLRYLPFGFGAHRYRAGDDWIVNVHAVTAVVPPGCRRATISARAQHAAMVGATH